MPTTFEKRNPRAALNVEASIRSTIDLLSTCPGLGREREGLNVRGLGVAGYPHTIYYRITDDEAWVVHIRDDRRKPVKPGEV